MSQITDWGAAVITAVAAGIASFMAALPTIVGALLILIIGWIIAGWVGGLVARLARLVRVDMVASRIGVSDFLSRAKSGLKVSDVIGEVVTWVVRLIFVEMAADRLGFPQVTAIINQVLSFIPNIIVAMIVLGVGAFLAQIASGLVRASASEAKIGNPTLLGKLTSGAVLAFAIIIALNELNVAPVVVNTLFIGLVAALALALGLAFGLGGKDTAARYCERWASGLEQNASKLSLTSTRTSVYGTTDAPLSGTTAPAATRTGSRSGPAI